MKEFLKKYKLWVIFGATFLLFLIYTLLVKTVDVQAIGPNDPKTGIASSVGFASINGWFHNLTGEHMSLYDITDWGSLITLPIGITFCVIGIVEWAKRKNILRVDANILALGCFYVLVFITYAVFEFVIKLNYRPVLIEDKGKWYLEASYPSSTTLLAITLLLSAIDQITIYIKNKGLRIGLYIACGLLIAFFVIGRAVSGVHWLTDIIGGVLASTFLIAFYMAIKQTFQKVFINK